MTKKTDEIKRVQLDAVALNELSQSEDEEDLSNISDPVNFNAVIMAADWTVETIANQIEKNGFELNPEFQRRDAWNQIKKSRYIESLTTNIPVPQIVLAEKKGARGKFVVLDGKQRMLSIQQYTQDVFPLQGLDLRPDLNGKRYSALEPDDRFALDNSTVRTAVVRNWQHEDFLYLIFLRLNTASSPLSPQELRQALHPGPFVAFANKYTADNLDFSRVISSRLGPDFRMRDVEILVRFFAFSHFLPRYRGNLKQFLDSTCQSLNEAVSAGEMSVRQLEDVAESCLTAIHVIEEIFQDNAFRRWNSRSEKFEAGFNRAVFDALTFYAKNSDVVAAMRSRPEEVKAAFIKSCSDAVFTESVTNTTKTNTAVRDRLVLWGRHLNAALDVNVVIPKFDEDGRLVEG
ncbi:MAG: DUF262 domain-containing protein [Alcaligenaceae bacterium]|nr:MAG: DUF262 domain-containing protein [Alcaligenaceae bacterium]